jgi:hypothetical protein
MEIEAGLGYFGFFLVSEAIRFFLDLDILMVDSLSSQGEIQETKINDGLGKGLALTTRE